MQGLPIEVLVLAYKKRRAPGLPSKKTAAERRVVTVLDKELKRQVTVDGVAYTLSVHPDGFRLTSKGKRKPEVELLWRDLLSGDAAMTVALNASLGIRSRVSATSPADTVQAAGKRTAKKRPGPATSS